MKDSDGESAFKVNRNVFALGFVSFFTDVSSEMVFSALRGTAYGIYYLIVGSSFFVANTVIGALWQYFGSSVANIYSIIFSSAATIGMLIFIGKSNYDT